MKLFPTLSLLKRKREFARQSISNCWTDRENVLRDDVNLFLWKRSLDRAIPQYLSSIIHSDPEPIQCVITSSNLSQQIEKARNSWDILSQHEGAPFWSDILFLANDFLEFAPSGTATLHLRIIADDACRKFHTDGYPLRLFTTYWGKGTEWLPEDAVDRSALGTQNDRIVRVPAMIRQMEAGEVGILKGESPSSARSVLGIVHRSPEMTQPGEKRIILRVDI